MAKILFVHNALRSFVRHDRDLLRENNDVVEVDYRWNASSASHILQVLPSCDMVAVWFASHHSFLPTMLGKLLGKKVIVFSGGYDVSNEPDGNYGSMRGGVPKLVNNIIFQLADQVLVPSEFSRQLALQNTVLRGSSYKVRVVPLGIPLQPAPTTRKERQVVTIGSVQVWKIIWRKGLKTFVDMAPLIPEVQCALIGNVGGDGKVLQERAPGNVTFWGPVSDVERDHLLARSAAYAQLSSVEGFGVAVVEAMQQNCVPVVTHRGALPEVVGDCGIYVPYDDPKAAAEGVREAVSRPELGIRAHERVAELFSLERRRGLLREVIMT